MTQLGVCILWDSLPKHSPTCSSGPVSMAGAISAQLSQAAVPPSAPSGSPEPPPSAQRPGSPLPCQLGAPLDRDWRDSFLLWNSIFFCSKVSLPVPGVGPDGFSSPSQPKPFCWNT